MTNKGTEQLHEALAAIYALTRRYGWALEDGKLGYGELATFLLEFPKVRKGLEGMHEIPAEFLDLTEDELPGIMEAMSNILTGWRVSFRNQDITKEVVLALYDMMPEMCALATKLKVLFERIKQMPPAAEAVV